MSPLHPSFEPPENTPEREPASARELRLPASPAPSARLEDVLGGEFTHFLLSALVGPDAQRPRPVEVLEFPRMRFSAWAKWRLLATSIIVFPLCTSVATAAVAPAQADRSAPQRSTACAAKSGPATVANRIPLRRMAPAQPPLPAGCINPIIDGGFEAGSPWPAWTIQTSTGFDTPLCIETTCGTGGGTAPPFAGANWAWFGGTAAAETATLGQAVTIPTTATSATLTFQMRIGAVSPPFTDTLTVSIDGTTLQTYTEPATAESGYTLRTIDVSAFADGGLHTLLFSYVGPGGDTANFSVDDVALSYCGPSAVTVGSTSALRTRRGVSVRWNTGSDNALLGFRVYRQAGSKRVGIGPSLLRARGAVAGSSYSFVDRSAPRGRELRYWIRAVHLDGSTTWHGPAIARA